VQAGNASNNAEARGNIAAEVSSLSDELERIGNSTNFNGTKLLDGSASALKFQVGADGDSNSQITVNLSSASVTGIASALKLATTSAGSTFDVDSASLTASTYTFSADNGSGEVTTVGVALAAAPTSVQDFANKLNADTDFAANFSATVIRDADGAATGITVRANNGGTVDVATDPGAGVDGGAVVASAPGGLQFDTADNAQAAIRAIDTQIEKVSTARATLGAYQNRLDHTIANTNVAIENLSASESRIRDVDMAQEMMAYTRSQILTQAGTAMLAQANQSQQNVLSLLR
jgi:flagellin